jgi:hypothetical protein
MEQKQIIKRKFKFMADFGGNWGWSIDEYDDGTSEYYCNFTVWDDEIDNGIETAKISPTLLKKIVQWQDYFEESDLHLSTYGNRTKSEMEHWNKTGIQGKRILILTYFKY